MMFLWNLKETLERVIYTPVLKMVKEKKSWYFLPFTILTRKSMLRILTSNPNWKSLNIL